MADSISTGSYPTVVNNDDFKKDQISQFQEHVDKLGDPLSAAQAPHDFAKWADQQLDTLPTLPARPSPDTQDASNVQANQDTSATPTDTTVTDSSSFGDWASKQLDSLGNLAQGAVSTVSQAVAPQPDTTTQPATAPQPDTTPRSLRDRNLISNQYDFQRDQELTPTEAASACGPTAALAFARYNGRNPTIAEAMDLAKQVGWTPSVGMAGGSSEVSLLGRMGVDSQYNAGAGAQDVANEVQAGRPVILDTPNHYYAIDDYDPNTGAFHVGGSGLALRGGSEWMTWDQIAQHGNGVTGSITLKGDQSQAQQDNTIETIRQQVNPQYQGYVDQAVKEAQVAGIDPNIFVRQIYQESGFNPNAGSNEGAKGIAQFTDPTARGYGIDAWDPDASLKAAAQDMADNLKTYNGDYRMALAAYNAGGGNVAKYGEHLFDPAYMKAQGWSDEDANQPSTYVKNILGPLSYRPQAAVDNGSASSTPMRGLLSTVKQHLPNVSGALGVQHFSDWLQGLPSLDDMLSLPSIPGSATNPENQNSYSYNDMAGINTAGNGALNQDMGVPQGPQGPTPPRYGRADTDTDFLNGTRTSYAAPTAMPQVQGLGIPGDTFNTGMRALGWVTDNLAQPFMGSLYGMERDIGSAVTGQPRSDFTSNLPKDPFAAMQELGRRWSNREDVADAPEQQRASAQIMHSLADFMNPVFWVGPSKITEALGLAGNASEAAPGIINTISHVGMPVTGAGYVASETPQLPGESDKVYQARQALGGMAQLLGMGMQFSHAGVGLFNFAKGVLQAAPKIAEDAGGLARKALQLGNDAGIRPGLGFVSQGEGGGWIQAYHGTASAFDRPDIGRFSNDGLYGPGYYTTSDPRVAASGDMHLQGYAEAASQGDLERTQKIENEIKNIDEELHSLRYGPLSQAQGLDVPEAIAANERERAAYMQELAGLGGGVGPNIRSVQIPGEFNLFHVEQVIPKNEVNNILQLTPHFQNVGRRDIEWYLYHAPTEITGQKLWDDLKQDLGPSGANRALANAGYDGIAHTGGNIMPMHDANGEPIKHQVYVVFPESVGQLRNGISGTMGGFLSNEDAARGAFVPGTTNQPIDANVNFAQVGKPVEGIGGAIGNVLRNPAPTMTAAAGAYTGYNSGDENTTPDERLRRAALGGVGGYFLGKHVMTGGNLGMSIKSVGGNGSGEEPTISKALENSITAFKNVVEIAKRYGIDTTGHTELSESLHAVPPTSGQDATDVMNLHNEMTEELISKLNQTLRDKGTALSQQLSVAKETSPPDLLRWARFLMEKNGNLKDSLTINEWRDFSGDNRALLTSRLQRNPNRIDLAVPLDYMLEQAEENPSSYGGPYKDKHDIIPAMEAALKRDAGVQDMRDQLKQVRSDQAALEKEAQRAVPSDNLVDDITVARQQAANGANGTNGATQQSMPGMEGATTPAASTKPESQMSMVEKAQAAYERAKGTPEQAAQLRPDKQDPLHIANVLLSKVPQQLHGDLQGIVDDANQFAGQRRGVMNDAAVRAEAEKGIGMSVEDFLASKPGRAFNAEQVVALGNTANKYGLDLQKMRLAQKANQANGITDAALDLAIAQKAVEYRALVGIFTGAAAEGGRTLRAFNQAMGGEFAVMRRVMQKAAKRYGVDPGVERPPVPNGTPSNGRKPINGERAIPPGSSTPPREWTPEELARMTQEQAGAHQGQLGINPYDAATNRNALGPGLTGEDQGAGTVERQGKLQGFESPRTVDDPAHIWTPDERKAWSEGITYGQQEKLEPGKMPTSGRQWSPEEEAAWLQGVKRAQQGDLGINPYDAATNRNALGPGLTGSDQGASTIERQGRMQGLDTSAQPKIWSPEEADAWQQGVTYGRQLTLDPERTPVSGRNWSPEEEAAWLQGVKNANQTDFGLEKFGPRNAMSTGQGVVGSDTGNDAIARRAQLEGIDASRGASLQEGAPDTATQIEMNTGADATGGVNIQKRLEAAYKSLGTNAEQFHAFMDAWDRIPADDIQGRYRLLQMLGNPSKMRWVIAYGISNMLSSTHTAGIVAVHGGIMALNHPLLTTIRGNPAEAATEVAGMGRVFGQALSNFATAFTTGMHSTEVEQALREGNLDIQHDPFAGKLGMAVTPFSRFIGGMHEFYTTLAYGGAMALEAQRESKVSGRTVQDLLKNPTNQMLENATNMAVSQMSGGTPSFLAQIILNTRNTAYTGLKAGGKEIPGAKAFGLLANSVFPFVRIPDYLLRSGLKITTAPLYYTATAGTHAVQAGIAASKGNKAEAITQLSKAQGDVRMGVVATGILAAIYSQAVQGNITGAGPSDPNRLAVLQQARNPDGSPVWQAHSVKIGNRWVDYTTFGGPFTLPLATVSGIVEASRTSENNINPIDAVKQQLYGGDKAQSNKFFNDVGANLARSLMDISYIRTLGDMFKSIDNGRPWGALASALITNPVEAMVPGSSLAAEIARMRDVQAKAPGSIPEEIGTRLPFLNTQIPNRVGVLGQPVTTPQDATSILMPGKTSAAGQYDPVLNELARLQQNNTPVSIKTVSATQQGYGGQYQGHLESPEQMRLVQTTLGQNARRYLENAMNQPGYAKLTDVQKAQTLDNAVRASDKQANLDLGNQIQRDPPHQAALAWDAVPKYAGVSGTPDEIRQQNLQISMAQAKLQAYENELVRQHPGSTGANMRGAAMARLLQENPQEAFLARRPAINARYLDMMHRQVDQQFNGALTKADQLGLTGIGQTYLPENAPSAGAP